MKWTIVTASVSRNAGGLFSSVRHLAQAAADLGEQIAVLGINDFYTQNDLAAWQPLPIETFPVLGPDRFHFAPRLPQAIYEQNPDIVHSHGIWNYVSVAVGKWHKRTGKPYVVHPHGMLDRWAVQHSSWRKVLAGALYENRHLQNATCIRALCDAEADATRAYGLTMPLCVIPNGIDLPPAATDIRPESSPVHKLKQAGHKVLLYLGRLHPKKGLPDLLRAWATAGRSSRAQKESWVLAIAGWDEIGHEAELQRLTTELGIAWADLRENAAEVQTEGSEMPSVFFLGPQFDDAKVASYHDCDAFVLPSLSEGLPMVVLEAWSHAKPALITPECNLPEGFATNSAIALSADVVNLHRGLMQLFEMSDRERQAMGARGLALVKESFTWPQIARSMSDVCQWILGGGPRPHCVRLI